MGVENCCAVCNIHAEHKCSACHNVYYCSKEHQKQDWKIHKSKCRPFKIDENENLGRHLVATRCIKPGELILQEPPLISGPPQVTPPVCLGCYKLLNGINSIECTKCGWPVCSKQCEASTHHRPECEITANIRRSKVHIQNFQLPHPNYQCLTVLRCLYQKSKNPNLWNKLSQLQSHSEERQGTHRCESDKIAIAQFIIRFFKYEDFTEDEILRVAGIIQINGHEVPLSETGYVSVYETASFFEHSCRANCSKSFTSSGHLSIRAATNIRPGEHLSICYTDPLWGTSNRRHHLYQTKYFSCYCSRCCDPTELGTNFSSLKCDSRDCPGSVVLDGPLKDVQNDAQSDDSFWKCTTCGKTAACSEINYKLERIGNNLSNMKKNNIQECKNFISNHSRVLHENHYHMTDVKLALIELLGHDKGSIAEISDDDLALKAKYSRELLCLVNNLVPAENRVRGVLSYELHSIIAEECRRKMTRGQTDPETIRNELLESRQVLLEAITLLSYEPSVLPEGKMALNAQKNLQDIDNWLRSIRSLEQCPL